MNAENPKLTEEEQNLSMEELRALAEIELLKVKGEAAKADELMGDMIQEVHKEADRRNKEIEDAHKTGPHRETRKMLHKWLMNMQDIENARVALSGFPMLKPPIPKNDLLDHFKK